MQKQERLRKPTWKNRIQNTTKTQPNQPRPFTIKEYGEPLAKLEKQGDPRAPRSDLEALEAVGLIKKVRSGVHGV